MKKMHMEIKKLRDPGFYICEGARFPVPSCPDRVRETTTGYQRRGGHHGKVRNGGFMLGKWKRHASILCASFGYDLKMSDNMSEYFGKKNVR